MSSGRLIAGLIIIAIGALFLLDSVSEAVKPGRRIPVVAYDNRHFRRLAAYRGQVSQPVRAAAANRHRRAALQLWQLDAFGDNLGRFWPIVLIAVGIAILAGGMHRRRRRNSPSAGLQAVIDVEAAHVVEGDSLNATLSTDNRAVSGRLSERQHKCNDGQRHARPAARAHREQARHAGGVRS